MCLAPHLHIASETGFRVRPYFVSEYSTRGGKRDGRLLDFARSELDDPNPRVFLTLRASEDADVSRWLCELLPVDYINFEITKLYKPK